MSRTIKWINGAGYRKYQPATDDGEREWIDDVYEMPVWEYPRHASKFNPKLYRIRLHAKLAARRYERRKAAHTWEEA